MSLIYIDNDPNQISWKININSIKNFYLELASYEVKGQYFGETVVIQGKNSYPWKIDSFNENFPNLTEENIKIVENAGN